MAEFIDEVLEFNRLGGRPEEWSTRDVALHTGFQLEELAEKLDAILVGIQGKEDRRLHAWQLTQLAKAMEAMGMAFKQGFYDQLVEDGDRHEMLDADVDVMVVTTGSMMTQGADVKGACGAVAGANLAKKQSDGTLHKDTNGKIMKPAGWKPADLYPFMGK